MGMGDDTGSAAVQAYRLAAVEDRQERADRKFEALLERLDKLTPLIALVDRTTTLERTVSQLVERQVQEQAREALLAEREVEVASRPKGWAAAITAIIVAIGASGGIAGLLGDKF